MSACRTCRPSPSASSPGPGAEAWLDSIFANRIPKKVGRIAPLPSPDAATAACAPSSPSTAPRAQGFYLVSAGAWERHDHDILQKLLPADGSVRFYPVTTRLGRAGRSPARSSRELLQKLTDADLSNAAFPWLTGKKISVGPATTHALRVNFVGELGWELHHPIEMQNAIFDLLCGGRPASSASSRSASAPCSSMAVEKSYRLIGRELSIEYAALESGLDRFVHPNKGEFIGRDALVAWRERGFKQPLRHHGGARRDRCRRPRLRADPRRRRDGRPLHPGGYGWRVGKSLALGMVRPDLGEIGQELTVQILGKPHRATVIAELPYDPEKQEVAGMSRRDAGSTRTPVIPLARDDSGPLASAASLRQREGYHRGARSTVLRRPLERSVYPRPQPSPAREAGEACVAIVRRRDTCPPPTTSTSPRCPTTSSSRRCMTTSMTGCSPRSRRPCASCSERSWTPYDVLTKALVEGMRIVGIDFRDGILFVPEVLLAANAMKAGMAILRPLLAETGAPKIGKMVIGTVKGDIHDIGKNLVCMMMEGAGFEVIDLGVNNSVEKYLAAISEHQPDIVGMSALLTTTMPYMKVVIDTLKEKGIRNDYIVLVGGAPVNESFAMSVGADAYCRDAPIAVETAKSLLAKRQGSAQAGGLA